MTQTQNEKQNLNKAFSKPKVPLKHVRNKQIYIFFYLKTQQKYVSKAKKDIKKDRQFDAGFCTRLCTLKLTRTHDYSG